MLFSGEKDPIFLEGRVEGLVLASDHDTIQLEANVISLRRCPTCKAGVEAQPDLVTTDDMNMAFEPVPCRRVNPLHENTVTCRPCERWTDSERRRKQFTD
jgi:hypothetical protein